MEEIRRAAKARYDNMSSREKNEVFQMFTSHDANGDGRISFQEVFNQFAKSMPTDNIVSLFSVIETDGKDFLDFSEFVTLHYMIKSRPLCDCCKKIVTGLYFCCVRCWELYVHSGVEFRPYDLCSGCYYSKSFRHEHQEFLDNFMLLRSEARQQSRRKEKALEAGRLYFKFLTEPELNVAHQVFREMDQNGDGRVHSNEVIDFLIREGWSPREAQKTFDDSGLMRNTDLTLEDAVAFWYVMMSMPSCDSCSDTLVGLYYTCPACFHDSDKNTYDLCPGCYSKYGNEHGILVDSHALLQNLRNQEGSRASSSTGTQGGVTNKRRSLRKKSISMVTEEAVKAAVREGVNMGINAAAQGACSIM